MRLSTGRMHTPESWLAVQAAVRVCGTTIAEAATASILASGAARVGAAVVGSHQRQEAVAPSKMVQAATAHQGQPCSYHARRREGSPGREIHRPLLLPQVISASPPCRGPPRARSHDWVGASARQRGEPGRQQFLFKTKPKLRKAEIRCCARSMHALSTLVCALAAPNNLHYCKQASISPSQGGVTII